jgi:hypothetical protein
MEELRVEVLVVMEHAPDGVEEAAHDGDDRDFFLFAAGEEGLVGGLDLRATLDGDQRGHEQRQAQMAVAGAADVARGVGGAALARARIEPGVGDPLFGFECARQDEQFAEELERADFPDAGHAAEPLDLHGELGVTRGEFGSGLLQSLDALLELTDMGGQIGGDDPVAIRGKGDGMQPGLFPRQFAAELDQAPAELLQSQDSVRGRRPRDEVHALQELEDAERIDAIGLGPGQPGALEVLDGSGIDDHDLDAFRPVQSERQAQAVDARGFQANAGVRAAPGQQLAQLPVTGGGVGEGAGAFGMAITKEGADDLGGADIEAGTDDCELFHGLGLALVLGLRVPDLLRMSSTDLVYAGSPKRQRSRGLRYSAAWPLHDRRAPSPSPVRVEPVVPTHRES